MPSFMVYRKRKANRKAEYYRGRFGSEARAGELVTELNFRYASTDIEFGYMDERTWNALPGEHWEGIKILPEKED